MDRYGRLRLLGVGGSFSLDCPVSSNFFVDTDTDNDDDDTDDDNDTDDTDDDVGNSKRTGLGRTTTEG